MTTLEHAFSLPLVGTSRALFQGADAARDPRDGKLYLFQGQASATGPGDVEDLAVHRYSLSKTLQPTYLDTMLGKTFGHVQSLHGRISAAGNPWVWLGAERYDDRHHSAGYDLLRVRHRRGIVTRTAPDVQPIHTGAGSVQALPCPDWSVVLRRPGEKTETYEWHSEKALLARTAGDPRPTPLDSITVPRGTTTYQSAAAHGTAGEARRLVRVNGATDDRSRLTDWQKGWPGTPGPLFVDVTAAAPPGLKVTSEEPESAFFIGDQLYIGKRFNSTRNRVVAYFRLLP